MASSSNNKNIDTDKLIQWVEGGVAEDYINYHVYSGFKDIRFIGHGAFGKVYKATWESSNTVVALKSFERNNLIMKEIVNEVLCNIVMLKYRLLASNIVFIKSK